MAASFLARCTVPCTKHFFEAISRNSVFMMCTKSTDRSQETGNNSQNQRSEDTSNISAGERALAGFARALEKAQTTKADAAEETQQLQCESEYKTFASMLRHSKLIQLGDMEGRMVLGTVIEVVGDDLYIDVGAKFHCVCPRPKLNSDRYHRGVKVKLRLNDLEMSSSFLGSEKHVTLLEADATLIGLRRQPLSSSSWACKAADGSQLTVGDYVKLYNTIVDFKNKVTKIFLETGLVKESAKLDLLPIVAMETHIVPEVQQLSSDVLLMFKLIADLIRATLVKKTKQPTLVNTLDMASKTEVDPETLVNCSPVKQEMTDNFGESENHSFDSPSDAVEIIPVNNVTPPVLRKSSRTSVLNRKPFGKPHRQKPTVKPFGKPHRQKPSVKLVGAKKRKQGSIRKILNASLEKKKALPVIVNDADVNGVNKGRTPKAARRAAVFATNLYERTLEGMFRCKECGKEAKLQTNIRKHLRKHTGEKLFQCPQCSKTFNYQQDLSHHSQIHKVLKSHKNIRKKLVEIPPNLPKKTLAVKSSDSEDLSSSSIDADSVNESSNYKRTRSQGTNFRPDDLQEMDLSEVSDEETQKTEAEMDEESQDGQNETASLSDTLPTGFMYEATELGHYRCSVCGRETKDRSNIRKHFMKWHAGEKRYRCSKCSKAFAYPESLKHHQKVHVDPSTRAFERTGKGTYRCKHCEHESKNRSNIVKHVKRRHLDAGEKPYKCKLCPAVFAYPRSLKRHELVHEGIRPFKCHQCDKCFFDPTSLRTHGRVHTDDRPYVCQVCGDRFRQNEGLKGHMRRHTGDRPYVCERCGMAFAAKRSLTRHIRVHTGERPYPCDQCVAAFADWTTLHNHKLVHRDSGTVENAADVQDKVMDGRDAKSENRPYQCQFCGVGYRQPLSLKRHLRLHSANASPKKSTPKKISKRMQQDNGELDGEAAEALHRQYRPYQCELCGAKFKHLRGHETHMNKHETGTLVSKKTSKQAKRISVQQPSSQDFEQAVTEQVATILASVAVNNTTLTSSNGIPMTVLHPQSTNSTVTVIDASAINSLSVADPTATHLTVTNPVQDTTNVIQYTSENVTQVIQYPDGTLSQVTALVPHHPSSTLVQPMDLLDSMVTVVFEANTGTIIGETH